MGTSRVGSNMKEDSMDRAHTYMDRDNRVHNSMGNKVLPLQEVHWDSHIPGDSSYDGRHNHL